MLGRTGPSLVKPALALTEELGETGLQRKTEMDPQISTAGVY